MATKSLVEVEGFTLGGDMAQRATYPASLGTHLYDWNGQDLAFQTGELPPGFYPANRTGYKQWIRGRHSTSTWFSYGPYQNFGQGQVSLYVFLAAPLGARGEAGEGAFLLEFYDFDSNTVRASVRPKVSHLPTSTPGFAVYTPSPLSVVGGHRYEIRVMALGGCDLEFHFLRAFADVL